VAERSGKLEVVRDELNALAECFEAVPEFRTFAVAGRKSRQDKKETLGRMSEEMGLSELTTRLLLYLVQKRRMAILPSLAESLSAEVDRRLGIARGRVTSATPLSDQQRQDLVRKLQRITGKTIDLTEETDGSLIAGFQVRLDGTFFDGSLEGQLERIAERIAHGG
jgi:F-type H+-transporting ATPase subunit delta